MTTEEFIRINRYEDVRELALRAGRYPDVDVPFALNQIAGMQTAARKIPSWAAVDGILYPPHLSMEQCSSEFTARYKANVASPPAPLLQRGEMLLENSCCSLSEGEGRGKDLFIDLTGGMGVDFSFMARSFDRAIYVERQESLCQNARHNFPLLGIKHVEVVCSDGVEYLHSISHASLIYLDPARRDVNGSKTVAISDCVPDVLSILDELLDKADYVMLKLSPMLDWHKAMADLRYVSELHIVSSGNECKELLFVLSRKMPISSNIYCVNDNDILVTSPLSSLQRAKGERPTIPLFEELSNINMSLVPPLALWRGDGGEVEAIRRSLYLYEPNASIMKAGCFAQLCERYGVKAVGDNSHLFVSNDGIGDFPGRKFVIWSISTLNKNELKLTLAGITKANIATRNFPLSVAELRKRLKLKDGCDTYIFATTTANNKHVLLICHKV